jgi:hypothetical protein
LITGCTSTTNVEALKKVKTIAVPLEIVNLRPHSLVLKSGSNFRYNLSPEFGLENKMLPAEKEFLDQKLTAIDQQLSILDINLKKIPDLNTQPHDEHVYYPHNSTNIDFNDKENLKNLCAVNNLDALGSINIEFHKVFYDEPFAGSFIKMRAKALVKLFASSGEEILSREITGESTEKLAQDFKLTISIPLIKTGGLFFEQDVDFKNDSETEKYLLNSFNLRNNYALLYEDALNDLILKIQAELNAVKNSLL